MADKWQRKERKAAKMGPLQTTLKNSLHFSLESVTNVFHEKKQLYAKYTPYPSLPASG